MRIGIAIPDTPDGPALRRLAQRAEELGFESVLVPDHIVLPAHGTDQYPYSADGAFTRPSDEPFVEPMTLLGYLAGCTGKIRLGTTVTILPYRNPIVQAKMFASLDALSGGRIICGVGVGWLEKEFDTLGVPYAERGPMSDEFLQIFKVLWTEAEPVFHGRFYQIEGVRFYPKPVQKPSIPIWVGGNSRRALRRAARYGDCWHATRQTPESAAKSLPFLRGEAEKLGRDPASISVSLKRSLHFTDIGLPVPPPSPAGGALMGSTAEVVDDLRRCRELGFDQLTFDFRVKGTEEMLQVMEHLAHHLLPVARDLD